MSSMETCLAPKSGGILSNMQITSLIVAEGMCPDIHLTLGSVKELSMEIVIVDIGMDKQVREKITTEYPAIVWQEMEKPEYVELIRQKTFQLASCPWILLLDPDEYISPGLATFIKQTNEDQTSSYFRFPRQNYIFGKWIAHSRWWPDYQIRLFKKDSINWPTTLHAQPTLIGNGYLVGAFEDEKLEMNASAIVHHNYTNVTQYLEKAIRYARVEAEGMNATDEQYTIVDACKKATGEFISRFFSDRGYRDGVHGFALAILQMFYSLLVYLFFWEKNGYPPSSQVQIMKAVKQLFVTTSKETYYWLHRSKLVKGMEGVIFRVKSRVM